MTSVYERTRVWTSTLAGRSEDPNQGARERPGFVVPTIAAMRRREEDAHAMRRLKRAMGSWTLGLGLGLAIGIGAGIAVDAEAQAAVPEPPASAAALACVADSDCPVGQCCRSFWIFHWCVSC